MRTQFLHDHGAFRIFMTVLDQGDETMANLEALAEAERPSAAPLPAPGAFQSAESFFLDREARQFCPIPVDEQTKATCMIGDIAIDPEGKPALHVPAVLGKCDGTVFTGHPPHGKVRPTSEVMITGTPGHLRRAHGPGIRPCPDPRMRRCRESRIRRP